MIGVQLPGERVESLLERGQVQSQFPWQCRKKRSNRRPLAAAEFFRTQGKSARRRWLPSSCGNSPMS